MQNLPERLFFKKNRPQHLHVWKKLYLCTVKQKDIGLWCNGNTTDSGPVILGSNPGSPAKKEAVFQREDSLFSLCPAAACPAPPCRARKNSFISEKCVITIFLFSPCETFFSKKYKFKAYLFLCSFNNLTNPCIFVSHYQIYRLPKLKVAIFSEWTNY